MQIIVSPAGFSDWLQLLSLLGESFAYMDSRIALVENHATFGALGFEKVAETAHPGYTRPTSITMRKRVAGRAA